MGTRIFLSILCYALSIFIVGACMLDTRGKVLKFAAAIGAYEKDFIQAFPA